MILDTLHHAERYRHLGPRLARGFTWLENFSTQMPDGRCEIDGDNVFALVQSYDTVAPGEKKFESHRIYLDIQFVADGTEIIHYAPLSRLSPVTTYDEVKDFSLYADPGESTPLLLSAGSFAVFYPHDGHKPGCVNGAFCRIKKVVVKVRV